MTSSNSVAQTAAGILTIQEVITGLLSLSGSIEPDYAMAVAINTGIRLAQDEPVTADILANAVEDTLANRDRKVDHRAVSGITASMYETYALVAEGAIERRPDLAAGAAAELGKV